MYPFGVLKVAALVLLMTGALAARSAAQEEVTTEEVKKFLDPTVMIHSFGYSFGANYLPGSTELYAHTLQPTWAFSHWTAVWADIPLLHLAQPEAATVSGVGDVLLGWGAVIHEDLSREFTSSAAWLEVLAPTGDAAKGLGAQTWVLAPGGGLALNVTDRFPIYVTGGYRHSLGNAEVPVRSIELNVETAHILPKGIFVSVVPSFFFNLNRDVHFFSLGIGAGRALTRRFAFVGAYSHHLIGSKTFNQAFTVGLQFIWGEEKTAAAPP